MATVSWGRDQNSAYAPSGFAEFQAFLAVQEAEVLRGNAELERKVRDFARAERVRRGSEARGSGKARVGPGRDAGLARGFLLSA